MAKLYRTREGDVTAVDARTQLTTVGSETAPGPLLVPTGMTHIVAVHVSHISNMSAATGYSAFIRLEGPGLQNGPECIAIGAGGMAVATGGNYVLPPRRIAINLPVTSANEVLIFAEMAGTDVGLLSVNVTLEFASAAGAGDAVNRTFTVEGDITAADTKTILSTQGSVTAPSPVVPSGMKKISKIVFACTAEGLANGAQNWFLRLGGNAVLNGEQVISMGASGTIAVQAGSDASVQATAATVLEDVDIEVRASDTISVSAEGAGTDTGTGHAVVTLVYA